MIAEQTALLDTLEQKPELPLHQKRGMLDRLSQEIGRMDEASYRRYKSIATAVREELIASICPCTRITER